MDIRFSGVPVHKEENGRLGGLLLNRGLLFFCWRVIHVICENNSGLRRRWLVFAIFGRFCGAPTNCRYLVKLVLKVQLQFLVVVQEQDTLGLVTVVYELL